MVIGSFTRGFYLKKPGNEGLDSSLGLEDINSDLYDQAHKAATSPYNDLPIPSQAMYEAGNYKKGHIQLHGFNIAIECPKDSERSGIDKDGKKWTCKMYHHYGYIKGSIGADKEHLDVFIGDNAESEKVFVVNQMHPHNKEFDEHKVMMGFDDLESAHKGYLKNYMKGWKGVGSITEITLDEMKEKIEDKQFGFPIVNDSTTHVQEMKSPEWIGFDLDGTTAEYTEWKGIDHIGEPIMPTVNFIKELISKGEKIKIFTARATDEKAIPHIEDWLEKHGIGGLEITNVKDNHMKLLYDDRARQVVMNTGKIVVDKTNFYDTFAPVLETTINGEVKVEGLESFDPPSNEQFISERFGLEEPELSEDMLDNIHSVDDDGFTTMYGVEGIKGTGIIRLAKESDLNELVKLWYTMHRETNFLREPTTEESTFIREEKKLKLTLKYPNLYLVVEDNKKLVGALRCEINNYWYSTKPYIAYFALGVLKSHWGHGYGSNLINQMISFYKTNHETKSIRLFVYKDNLAAIALYTKHGFKVIRNLPFLFEMELKL